jgi:hypothetical protein
MRSAARLAGAIGLALLLGQLPAGPASAADELAAPHAGSTDTGWDAESIASRTAEQAAMIRGQQRPSGAILHGSGGVNPYFGNYAALGLLAEGSSASVAAAARWLDWVHAHLNTAPTADGGRYTIDDYAIVQGAEVDRHSYDSVDSYAATTLMVAAQLWQRGDSATKAGVVDRMEALERVADLLGPAPTGVRKTSGLTQATFTYNVAYLMDNAEVASGLRDFAALENSLGRGAQASTYGGWAETVRTAIIATQWNAQRSLWSWHDSVAPTLSGPFYAQSMAQYFPVVFGVVAPDDPRALASWTELTSRWPDWRSNRLDRAEAATPMAYAAALVGDTSGARAMLDDIAGQYSSGWHYPTVKTGSITTWWSPSQAGWYIRTLQLVESSASTGR